MRSVLVAFLVFVCGALSSPARSQQSATLPGVLESLPEHFLYLQTDVPTNSDSSEQRQLYANARRWEAGQTLKVCFFGGNDTVNRLIADTASEWAKYANLRFDFGTPGRWRDCLSPRAGFSHIRIGFGAPGYWSLVGTDSQRFAADLQPSMNLQNFNLFYSAVRFKPDEVLAAAKLEDRGTILHEFGHAIGLLHEHQNPNLNCAAQIKWEGADNVYDYLAGPPNYWPRAVVDRNLGNIGTTDPDYVKGEPDTSSIMMYALPRRIFKDGAQSCIVEASNKISAKDRQIVAALYSPNAQIVEDDLKSSDRLSVPSAVSPRSIQADFSERIIADLDSSDVSVRRDARVRLARYIETTDSRNVASIVAALPSGSYRYQLGVAVALKQAKNINLSAESKSIVRDLGSRATDATLRSQIQSLKIFE